MSFVRKFKLFREIKNPMIKIKGFRVRNRNILFLIVIKKLAQIFI